MKKQRQKYGEKIANNQKDLLIKIAISNTAKKNKEFLQNISNQIQKNEQEIEIYENTKAKINQITNHKKQLLTELNKIEQILGQDVRLKEEYEKSNEIFNIKILKKQLTNKKQELLEQIEKDNYLLKPLNYINEKDKLIEKQKKLKMALLTQKEIEETLIKFIENIFKCFRILIKTTEKQEDIVRFMYQFRYFILLPFNLEKEIKDIKKLQKDITEVEKILIQKAKAQKVITDNVSIEIMDYILKTRIIILEELYYKITKKSDEYIVQIFDGNVSEEKFEIKSIDKMKTNRKIKIFI